MDERIRPIPGCLVPGYRVLLYCSNFSFIMEKAITLLQFQNMCIHPDLLHKPEPFSGVLAG